MELIKLVIPVFIEIVIPMLFLLTVYKKFNAVKYYAKFTFFFLSVTIVPIVLMPYFALRPRNVLNFILPSLILQNTSKIIGIKFTLRGAEHLRKHETCVIVSNHQSSLDILEFWPIARKLTVIARMLLIILGPFGIGAWLCGLEFINKDSADSGKKTMNEAMERLKKKKTKVMVFPEGYRNHSGAIDVFKKGAFHMAIQSQVPIVPVVFSSYKSFMNKKKKEFNSGEVVIEALPEIPTKGLKSEDVNLLMEKTREVIVKKFNELNEEIENKLKQS